MIRPPLEVADLVRAAGTAFLERNRHWIRWAHIKVLLAIARCRTAALGGHIDECSRCGHRATISYNSCRNRHCPKCQTGARELWLEARRRELLPSPYVMSSSLCLSSWRPWLCRTKRSSMICYSVPVQKLSSRSPAIPDVSGPRSASSVCCIPGTRSCSFIPMFTVSSLPAGSRSTIRDGSIPPSLLSSPPGAASRVSWQIRRRPQVRLPTPAAPLLRGVGPAGSAQDLRLLAQTTVSQALGGLLQTTLRWPRIRAPVSGPLHPSRGHLQPSPDFVG